MGTVTAEAYQINPSAVFSTVSTMDGLVSGTSSVVGDLGSMVLDPAAFGTFGSSVASANSSMQQQLLNGLNQTMALLGKISQNVRTAGQDYVAADAAVAQSFGGTPSNPRGELNGGVDAGLSTDLATLKKQLDAARAAGGDPTRYAALLKQYWLVKAANDAGIDLNSWDPQKGLDGNAQNVRDVYNFYGKLFLEHPELQWAGMANMIGPSFAAGFTDLESMKKLANSLNDRINTMPDWERTLLPPEVTDLSKLGTTTGNELGWYQDKFLAMQKNIFMDQASMHEAYLNGGMPAIDEMHSAGLIDNQTQTAWHEIASGDPSQIQNGNAALLSREQNQVIDQQWNEMRQHDWPVGDAVTYGMTVTGAASIPGTQTPGHFSPLTVSGQINDPGVIVDESVSAKLQTPLPDFNIADKNSRWNYITQDTLPAYQQLVQNNPDLARQIVATPLDDRINQQLLSNRLPQIEHDMLTNWKLDVNGQVNVHWPQLPWSQK